MNGAKESRGRSSDWSSMSNSTQKPMHLRARMNRRRADHRCDNASRWTRVHAHYGDCICSGQSMGTRLGSLPLKSAFGLIIVAQSRLLGSEARDRPARHRLHPRYGRRAPGVRRFPRRRHRRLRTDTGHPHSSIEPVSLQDDDRNDSVAIRIDRVTLTS